MPVQDYCTFQWDKDVSDGIEISIVKYSDTHSAITPGGADLTMMPTLDERFMASLRAPAFRKLMAAHDGYGERIDHPANPSAALARAAVRGGRQEIVKAANREIRTACPTLAHIRLPRHASRQLNWTDS